MATIRTTLRPKKGAVIKEGGAPSGGSSTSGYADKAGEAQHALSATIADTAVRSMDAQSLMERFDSMFTFEDDKIRANFPFYSTGSISALGSSSESGGGTGSGSSYPRVDAWSQVGASGYDGGVLSAILGKEVRNDLNTQTALLTALRSAYDGHGHNKLTVQPTIYNSTFAESAVVNGIYPWGGASDAPTTWGVLLNLQNTEDTTQNSYWRNQLAFGTNGKVYFRQSINHKDFSAWKEVAYLPEVQTLLNGKVDKVSGYGLSKNDLTDALLAKLNGIAEGANKYVHPAQHTIGEVANLDATIDEINSAIGDANTAIATKANVAHIHTTDDIDDLELWIHNKGYLGASAQAADSAKLGGELPSYYAKATDVAATNKALAATQTALSGKASTSHTHTYLMADRNGMMTNLDDASKINSGRFEIFGADRNAIGLPGVINNANNIINIGNVSNIGYGWQLAMLDSDGKWYARRWSAGIKGDWKKLAFSNEVDSAVNSKVAELRAYLDSLFVVENGKIKANMSLFSKGTISALGSDGTATGGGGGSYPRLDSWESYTAGDGSILSAHLGMELRNAVLAHSSDLANRYVKSEVDAKLFGKSDSNHNHDATYSKVGHGHAISEVSDLLATLDGKLNISEIGCLKGQVARNFNFPTFSALGTIAGNNEQYLQKLMQWIKANYKGELHLFGFCRPGVAGTLSMIMYAESANADGIPQYCSGYFIPQNANTGVVFGYNNYQWYYKPQVAMEDVTWNKLTGKPTTFTPSTHDHNDTYYTEAEIDTKLQGKSDSTHNHDTIYSKLGHKHIVSDITDLSSLRVDWSKLDSKPTTLSGYGITDAMTTEDTIAKINAVSDRLDSLFVKEGNKIKAKYSLYSVGTISALGSDNAVTGGGGDYIRLDDWADFDSEMGAVLSANLGYGVYERLNSLTPRVASLESGKADKEHGHGISEVTGLQAALDGKANSTHTHSTSQINGLGDVLSLKADLLHSHPQYLTEHQSLADYAKKTDVDSINGMLGLLRNDNNNQHSTLSSKITALETGKADETHTHLIEDVDGLENWVTRFNDDLGGKADTSAVNAINTALLEQIDALSARIADLEAMLTKDANGNIKVNGNLYTNGTISALGIETTTQQ